MYKFIPLALLFILTLPVNAFGWGKEGHMIVGHLAQLGLTEKTKAALKEIGYTELGLDEVANFPDKVRRNKNYPQYAKSGPWHFVDLPIEGNTIKSVKYVRTFSDSHQPDVIRQIQHFAAVLRNVNSTKDEKVEAVKFLVHFVGDIHQPLHCADRHDYGGNALKVHYLGKGGKSLNLHHVWDTNLVKDLMAKRTPFKYAEDVFNSDSFDEKWVEDNVKEMNPLGWAWESYQYARDYAYQLDGHTRDKMPLPQNNRDGIPNLDQGYVNRGKSVVEHRLEAAGIRLAWMLNTIYDPHGSGYNWSHSD